MIEHYKGATIVINQQHRHKVKVGLIVTTIKPHASNQFYYNADVSYRGQERRTRDYPSALGALKAAKKLVDNWV